MTEPKDLRELIIDNAQEIFSKFGLRKTTMDEIAAKIHKAKSSVYYYFKSKEEIYIAVIEKEAAIFRSEINRVIGEKHTPKEKIKVYVLTRIKLFQKLANFYSAFQKEYMENYSFINKIRKNYDIEEQELIKIILEEGVAFHNLSVKDFNLTSYAILTAMKGFEYHWTIEREFDQIEKEIDLMLEILFEGLNIRN
ncbi:MAG: TetR/AcrR family transcriptional regulator [Bacteroidales bacterium]|nr:TetR/AcrR family transcriptional regulator [Bacteroidales bacterium]